MVAYKAALTTTEVDKLPLRDKDYRINLGLSGLYVNVWRGGGPPTFTLWCRCQSGRVRQPTLGRRPTMTADEAFTRAIDWLRVVRDGGDPIRTSRTRSPASGRPGPRPDGALLPLFVVRSAPRSRAARPSRRVLRQSRGAQARRDRQDSPSPHLTSPRPVRRGPGSPAATKELAGPVEGQGLRREDRRRAGPQSQAVLWKLTA